VFAYRPAVRIGWTFVAGSGILDKRSLLRAAPPAPAARVAAGGDDRVANGEGGGTSLLTVLAAAMLAVGVLIAGAVALARKH
ncbi:MAG TPA: hypothetical protein VGV67_15050, partial [Solirubrobacteraceae bacterium]|nr:hypothetical protein [Solirubrobacteraceae bacterium]